MDRELVSFSAILSTLDQGIDGGQGTACDWSPGGIGM